MIGRPFKDIMARLGVHGDVDRIEKIYMTASFEFLSDATGTLDFTNEAGTVKVEELHRATLVTQQFRFSKVQSVQAWVDSLG